MRPAAFILALMFAVSLAPLAVADNWEHPPENVINDPYGTVRSAWGSWADVMILGIFMTAVVLVYMKAQSVGPPLIVFIIGSIALGTLFPSDTNIQKMMFIMGVVGLVGMLYYAFVHRWGE